MRFISMRGAAALALAVILAACGGSAPTAGSDPQGTVTAAFTAAQSGGFLKLTDFACAAHKDDIAQALGGQDLSALQGSGVNVNDMLSALQVSFSNLTTKEVSKTDTAATVHVTADMQMSFDKEKFKTILKTMLGAKGLPTDDATVDAMLSGMSSAMTRTQKVDEDIMLTNEGGKWLICG
jgi:hypothetical protein